MKQRKHPVIFTTLLAILLASQTPSISHAKNQKKDKKKDSGPKSCLYRYVSALERMQLPKTGAEVKAYLVQLQKHVTPEQVQEKIDFSKHAFKLYRSFVDGNYSIYKILKDSHQNRFKSIESFNGWIFGDMHMENFGAQVKPVTVLDKKGREIQRAKAIFSPNDPDDGMEGALYLDPLRLMGSVKLWNEKADLKGPLAAYKAGLAGKPAPKNKVVEKMLKEAEERGFEPKGAYDVKKGRIERDDASVELTKLQRQEIQKAVSETYGKDAKVVDAVFQKREGGGSGGLDRYSVAIEFPDSKKFGVEHALIEFKEIGPPAPEVLLGPSPLSPTERVMKGLRVAQGENLSGLFQTRVFDGKPMQLRPKFKGNIGVDLNELNKKDAQEIIQYQFWLLGNKARETAKDPEGYRQAVEGLSDEVWFEEAERTSDIYRAWFDALKSKE